VFPLSQIQRGDVIVFKFPAGRDSKVSGSGVHYIKRVIGVPGDIVDIRNRQIYINGEILKQEYIGSYEYLDDNTPISTDEYEQSFLTGNKSNVIYRKGLSSTTQGYTKFPITVPQGNIFVMGDNRDNSYDSRFWGFVPIQNVSGKAFLIHWSWDFNNSNIVGKVRWNRIFSDIN
ncbi:MAG: signal peptidase I, partial [Thermodesulfobacteriota bacterium]